METRGGHGSAAPTISRNMNIIADKTALIGFIVWVAILFLPFGDSYQTELVEKVVLFGILVVVPAGLSLVCEPDRVGRYSTFLRWALLLQPFAAAAALASLLLPKGPSAALLATPLLLVHLCVALFGLSRLLQRGLHPWEELSVDAGLVFLPVAGFWFIVYRLGIQPFDFGEMIILLTAAHFQFAGFAAPLLAGMTGRFISSRKYPVKLFAFMVISLLAGIPLVAIGITFYPSVAFVGAVLITTGAFLLAVLNFGWVLPRLESWSTTFLLMIAGLASCSAMVLACLYAYSVASKTLIIDIPTMARTHGLINAFGFVTCSLIVWTIVRPCSRPRDNS